MSHQHLHSLISFDSTYVSRLMLSQFSKCERSALKCWPFKLDSNTNIWWKYTTTPATKLSLSIMPFTWKSAKVYQHKVCEWDVYYVNLYFIQFGRGNLIFDSIAFFIKCFIVAIEREMVKFGLVGYLMPNPFYTYVLNIWFLYTFCRYF